MSGSLYGMQGMGSTGGGMGASPQIPPQLLQLLMQRQQQGGGGFQAPPGPIQAAQQPGANSPLSALIGQGQLQQHPMMGGMPAGGQMPQGPGPQPAQPAGQGNPMQLAQLLAALKGQQNGLTPPQGQNAGGALGALGNATGGFGGSGWMPAWLQGQLGGGVPGMPAGGNPVAFNGMAAGPV